MIQSLDAYVEEGDGSSNDITGALTNTRDSVGHIAIKKRVERKSDGRASLEVDYGSEYKCLRPIAEDR